MVHIPDEIVDEILYRLPVKSLLRFKCVSKYWHSVISNPNFHYKREIESMLRVEQQTGTVSVYSIEDDNKVVTELKNDGEKTFVSNSCNGLVILGFGESFFMFNPSTRYMVKVLALDCMRHNSIVVAGFCYDASTNDYKVVTRFTPRFNDTKVVAVASLKTKQWAQINFLFDAPSTKAGPIVNGRMHWTVNTVPGNRSSKNIICFDPCTDIFEEFPSPQSKYGVEKAVIGLGVLGERLYAITTDCQTCRVFIMNEYGVGESWTMLTNTPIIYPPYLFTKKGEILGRISPSQILAYDPIKRTERVFHLENPKEVLRAIAFVQNLASPVGYEWDEVRHANHAENVQWLEDDLDILGF